ncbi:MAG TPA: hypothetical protein VGV38_07750 [Pyrinomonadaceae bacterium]|nr:hypothetical protein [Pyrinomonadaceae bacterium]
MSKETHRHIEEFMRVHFRDPQLVFPEIHVFTGPLIRWWMRTFAFAATTVGRFIVVTPEEMRREPDGRWWMTPRLLVHECTHVVQFQRTGLVRFLLAYLRDYVRLMGERGWKPSAHKDAYRNLPVEVAARAAEADYAEWLKSRAAPARPDVT